MFDSFSLRRRLWHPKEHTETASLNRFLSHRLSSADFDNRCLESTRHLFRTLLECRPAKSPLRPYYENEIRGGSMPAQLNVTFTSPSWSSKARELKPASRVILERNASPTSLNSLQRK